MGNIWRRRFEETSEVRMVVVKNSTSVYSEASGLSRSSNYFQSGITKTFILQGIVIRSFRIDALHLHNDLVGHVLASC